MVSQAFTNIIVNVIVSIAFRHRENNTDSKCHIPTLSRISNKFETLQPQTWRLRGHKPKTPGCKSNICEIEPMIAIPFRAFSEHLANLEHIIKCYLSTP